MLAGSTVGDITNAAGANLTAPLGIGVDDSSTTGQIRNAGAINAGSGAVIDDEQFAIGVRDDSVVTGVINQASGVLNGSVFLGGTNGSGGGIDLLNEGAINLGGGQGTVSGDFSQTAGGSLSFTLNSLSDYTGVIFDIAGDATFGGELLLDFAADFALDAKGSFSLIDVAGASSGGFSNLTDGQWLGSFDGHELYLDITDSGDVNLESVPAPASLALLGIGFILKSSVSPARP